MDARLKIGVEIWRIKYDDGDMEELDILELLQVTKEHKYGNLASNKDPMLSNTTKRELTRKGKRKKTKKTANKQHQRP